MLVVGFVVRGVWVGVLVFVFSGVEAVCPGGFGAGVGLLVVCVCAVSVFYPVGTGAREGYGCVVRGCAGAWDGIPREDVYEACRARVCGRLPGRFRCVGCGRVAWKGLARRGLVPAGRVRDRDNVRVGLAYPV